MKITTASFSKSVVDSIQEQKISRPYTKNKDLRLDREMAWMCDAYYRYVEKKGRVPSMDEYVKFFCELHHCKCDIEDPEKIIIQGMYGRWIWTTRQKLYDRLWLGYTAYCREMQLLEGLTRRGISAHYESEHDKDGIDIVCDIDGREVGIAAYTATEDGFERKAAKNKKHKYDIPMVDAPCLLGGSDTVKLENEIILYDSAYIDGIAAQVRAKIKYGKNSVM